MLPSSAVTPPAILKIISLRVQPKGTSISPVLAICPVIAKTRAALHRPYIILII